MDTIKLTNVETNLYINGLNTVPPGSIMCFAGSNAPQGWLLCNGQAINRVDYEKLFSTIGTTYGNGNGSTTFNLPNLQDRFPMGKGSNSLGNIGGSNSVTLNTSQLPSHSHSSTVTSNGSHSHTGSTNTTGSHNHTYVDAYFAENYGGGQNNLFGTSAGTDYDNSFYYRSSPVTNSSGDHSHTLTTNTEPNHTHTVTIDPTGSGSAINITNKYITLNYIIRY